MPCVMLVPTSIWLTFANRGSCHFVIVYLSKLRSKLNLLYLNSLRLFFCFTREGWISCVCRYRKPKPSDSLASADKVNVCYCENLVMLLHNDHRIIGLTAVEGRRPFSPLPAHNESSHGHELIQNWNIPWHNPNSNHRRLDLKSFRFRAKP